MSVGYKRSPGLLYRETQAGIYSRYCNEANSKKAIYYQDMQGYTCRNTETVSIQKVHAHASHIADQSIHLCWTKV
jgi:hypothetical protein